MQVLCFSLSDCHTLLYIWKYELTAVLKYRSLLKTKYSPRLCYPIYLGHVTEFGGSGKGYICL